MNGAIKLTPLYVTARQLDAQFAEQQGWRVPEVYSTVEAEVAAARRGVVLVDETPNGKLTVEGDRAEGVLQAVFDAPPLAIGAGVAVEAARVYRLRNDRFFVGTPPGGEGAALLRLAEAAKASGCTVTDMTHGRAEIRAVGPASQNLMGKVCGLDFHPTTFPDWTARQSSLARTAQLIIRRDIGPLPAFSIVGARSLGAYLWDTLAEAGREWGLLPAGRGSLDALAG